MAVKICSAKMPERRLSFSIENAGELSAGGSIAARFGRITQNNGLTTIPVICESAGCSSGSPLRVLRLV